MPMSDYVHNIRAKVGNDLLMMPGASAVIINDKGEILLQHRRDDGLWGTPVGAIDPGEESAETVIREVYEETGLVVRPERIVGVYGGKDNLVTYPNGDQIAGITIVFLCRPLSGEPRVNDGESLEVRYFSPENLPQLHPRYKISIEQALKNQAKAHFR